MQTNTPLRPALVITLLLSPLVALHLYFHGNWYSFFHDYSLGMALGIVSYWYLLIALIVAARIPVLDRLYGHDRVMRAHGILASVALTAAGGHLAFKLTYIDLSRPQILAGSGALAIFILVAASTQLFMVNNRLQAIPILHRLRSAVHGNRFLDYSRVKLLHNAVSLATVLLILHVLQAYSTAEQANRTRLMAGAGLIALSVYFYHKIGRVILLSRQRLRVHAIVSSGPGLITLSVDPVPARLKRHNPGQFCYLRIWSKECGIEEHPFTIASSPNTPRMEFAIKQAGDYTTRLSAVQPGTRLNLDGPYGIFTPDTARGPHLFIAGGIGITPFMSIVRDWKRRPPALPVTLIWSGATVQDLFCADLFSDAQTGVSGFTFIPVVTRQPPPPGFQPRITVELLRTALANWTLHEVTVCLCASGPLREAMITSLQSLGIRKNQIRFERFD